MVGAHSQVPGAPLKTFPGATSEDPAGWGRVLVAAERSAWAIVASTPGTEGGEFLSPGR